MLRERRWCATDVDAVSIFVGFLDDQSLKLVGALEGYNNNGTMLAQGAMMMGLTNLPWLDVAGETLVTQGIQICRIEKWNE
jgi:hypothetical protein